MPRVAITIMGFRCERCEHEWVPRGSVAREPKVCPRCKSPYWNRPRGRTAAYEAFAEAVASALSNADAPLTWAEIRTRTSLPQAFPNKSWIRKMETEIGLRQDVNAQGAIRWYLETGGGAPLPEKPVANNGLYDALETRLHQLLGRRRTG